MDATVSIRQASKRCASSDATAIAEEEKYGKPEAPPSLQMIPLRNTKVVYFVRHGQGFHNIAGKADPRNYLSWEYEDAHLTDFGWQQAEALKRHNLSQADVNPQVVIVSPMTRAIETAIGAFGGEKLQAGGTAPPLMHHQQALQGKIAEHVAVSSENCPPFIAWEGCREHLGQHPCDHRRPTEYYRKTYPGIDFSLVKEEEDTWWKDDERESGPHIKARGLEFVQWLMKRPEQRIAVVSHSSFLYFLTSNFGLNCSEPVKINLQQWYENCEMRTVIISDTAEKGASDPLWFAGGKSIGSINGQ